MKIAFIINTPGQVHLWYNIINILLRKNNDVVILARDQGLTCELLSKYGLQYTVYGKANSTKLGKILLLPVHFLKCLDIIRRFRPDILVGGPVTGAYISAILRKPLIAFGDTEAVSFFELYTAKYFTTVIVSPSCFRNNFGNKQIRINGYKELAYLHPNYFKPDKGIYAELGISNKEKFVIIRFNAFEAVHDNRIYGFSLADKRRLVHELEKYTRVYISAEGAFTEELNKYLLPLSCDRIHHALYYAQLLITDTGTMATEAAVLGTPTIQCLSNWAEFGNFVELNNKYDLLYGFDDSEKAIRKAIELIQIKDIKDEWQIKKERMLANKIDVTEFMVYFIENYPECLTKYNKSRMR